MVVKKVSEKRGAIQHKTPCFFKKKENPSLFWAKFEEHSIKADPDITLNFSEKNFVNVNFPLDSLKELSKQTKLRESFLKELIDMEGFKTSAYHDSAGLKTIGIGHNIDADKNYHLGDEITKRQAYELLKKDLLMAENAVSKMTYGRHLKAGQKEALVDLVFNLGPKKVSETKLIQYINHGQLEKAAREFNYIKVGKDVNTHLCQRRVQNLGNFFEDKPSEGVLQSMEDIFKKGEDVFNKRLKKTKNPTIKEKIKDQKAYYEKQTTKAIEDTREKLFAMD